MLSEKRIIFMTLSQFFFGQAALPALNVLSVLSVLCLYYYILSIIMSSLITLIKSKIIRSDLEWKMGFSAVITLKIALSVSVALNLSEAQMDP